ncbi:MAG: hypothetical protein U5L45_16155 [Saprospiraceae bacterium]|nr:hypothetical protein [Saprospiraceae bacterium]
MVHFSGKARKMNHISPLRASEASAKTSSLDFMYGFKTKKTARSTKSLEAIFERSEKEPVTI